VLKIRRAEVHHHEVVPLNREEKSDHGIANRIENGRIVNLHVKPIIREAKKHSEFASPNSGSEDLHSIVFLINHKNMLPTR
jgi:hypothetical protein